MATEGHRLLRDVWLPPKRPEGMDTEAFEMPSPPACNEELYLAYFMLKRINFLILNRELYWRV